MPSMSSLLPIDQPAPRWAYWLSWLAAVLILLATGYRIQRQYHDGGEYSADRAGMADFHNGVYYPSRAFIDGVIPYGNAAQQKYPIARPSPAYSPFVFLLHAPIAKINLPLADAICFVMIAALLAAAVWSVLDERVPQCTASWFPIVFSVVLATRPAHMTLVSGYFTGELVIGVLIALRFAKDRPLLAGIGVLLAANKPTFAIPLGLMLLYRRNWRALIWGVGLSVCGAVLATTWLAYTNGLTAILDAIREGQSAHMADGFELPANNWTRVDAVGIVSKWLSANPSELTQLALSFGLSVVPGAALWKLAGQGDDSGTTTMSGAIATLGLLVILYHHVYDTLICLGPIIGLTYVQRRDRRDDWLKPWFYSGKFRTMSRLGLLFLIGLPAWNYLSSQAVLLRLEPSPLVHRVITSLNAIALTIALLFLCGLILLKRRVNTSTEIDLENDN